VSPSSSPTTRELHESVQSAFGISSQDSLLDIYNQLTGATALVLYDADLTATPASLSQIVALDSSGRNEITLVETTLPLVFGIVGGVALVAGLILGFRGRRPRADLAELDNLPPRPLPSTGR